MTTVARETTRRPLRIRSAGARAIAAEPAERQLLSVAEAAQQIGVAEKTIRRYIDQNRLRAHRFGPKLLRIELDDLLSLATPAYPGSD
ncbi:DNA-binding protein [Microbacterium protaetiae]|uniref:DNA-binding protein n=1 Tax=Microbacterium protaetiae TaxID=2509458 RepID=A0A4P6EJ42_9MICO|nr:helix-turn-helix domain-containing protein [Microbacterium protaetiae]QAY61289.1 DNA-binding protein [Microbacterium protaetiae]